MCDRMTTLPHRDEGNAFVDRLPTRSLCKPEGHVTSFALL